MSKIVVVTAPSGAGKTTLVRKLLENKDNLSFSISATTRKKRGDEISGKDYHFLSNEKFEELVGEGNFVEWEEVYPGKLYGTLKSEVEKIWSDDKSAIFDIDVEGAKKIKNVYKEKALTIFIMPPSMDVLFDRLKNRKTESETDLVVRIEKASRELELMNEFDVIIINDDLEQAYKELDSVVSAFLAE